MTVLRKDPSLKKNKTISKFYKRAIFFLLFFSSIVFFGEQIFLGFVGNFARMYVHLAHGYKCSYESICWEKGQIVLKAFFVKDHCFSFQSPKVSISLSKRHLAIEKPDVTVLEIPKFSDQKPFFRTYSIEGGMLEGMGLSKALFSFKKEDKNEDGCLHIQWESSSLHLTVGGSDGCTHIGIELNQIPMAYFHQWIGNNWKGVIDGSFEILKENDVYKFAKGKIEATDISYADFCKGIRGKLDWEGPFSKVHLDAILQGLETATLSSDWEEMWNEGRLRLSISEGKIFNLDQVDLLFSFDGKSGAKWEVLSLCEDRIITAIGRGLLQGIQGGWLESEWSSLESAMILKGYEKEGRFLWELTARSLDAEILKRLQTIASQAGISSFPWVCLEGTLDGCIQVFRGEDRRWNWKVLDINLKDVSFQKDSYLFSCKEASLKDDAYVFSKGDFKIGDYWIGSDWSGEGNIASGLGIFSGKIDNHLVGCVWHGNLDSFDANLKFEGDSKGEISFSGKRIEDSIHFSINKSFGTLFSYLKLENFEMQGEIRADGVYCYGVKGICDTGKKIRFYAPRIETKGIFDIRFETEVFEIARLVGTSSEGAICVDTKRSHLFNHRIVTEILFSSAGVKSAHAEFSIFQEMLEFFLKPSSFIYQNLQSSFLDCSLVYDVNEGTKIKSSGQFKYGEEKVDLQLHLSQKGNHWSLHPLQISDCTILAEVERDKDGIFTLQGKGTVSDWLESDLNGKFQSVNEWWIGLNRAQMNLRGLNMFQSDIEGVLSGEGLIQWKGVWESDFDFSASPIRIGEWRIENQEPLHLFFSSEKGVSVKGVNASVLHLANPSLQNKCKVGLLQYDFEQSLFVFTQSQLYLTESICNHFPASSNLFGVKDLVFGDPLRLDADMSFSSNFSQFSLSMKEGEIPGFEKRHHVQNFHLDKNLNEWRINFDLDHQMNLIPVDLMISTDPYLKGRLMLENGMKIHWEYQDDLKIHAIEGKGLGLDASFHLEGDSLIGSAKIDCHRLKKILPPEIAQVFYDLKMGDGYELMGRIYNEKEGVSFQGMLSGKQFELFGFQFRNLMAQIELAKDHVHISDVKISDFSGFMKIDQIIAQGIDDHPWTISIPNLTVTELRPSLLQEVGKVPGELTPLVIRELKINDIQGILEDSNTYTGKGELYFINSYKREKSILEVPSDILSRIVGLDLDLLVPVCGTLRYELHDGFFHFTDLVGSYSENKRSEFFLVFNENSPKMDLDWNLNIQIKMNQYVIFKITESFIISVRGKLENPKFQLQRKKRFLDLAI